MSYWLEEYAKHFALNLGQALQGVRFIHSHPDVDAIAPRGSPKHIMYSVLLRSKRVTNDLFFAALPPRWHHTTEELATMRGVSFKRWFQYGYCAWRFTETGELKDSLSGVDKRWDPRCRIGP